MTLFERKWQHCIRPVRHCAQWCSAFGRLYVIFTVRHSALRHSVTDPSAGTRTRASHRSYPWYAGSVWSTMNHTLRYKPRFVKFSRVWAYNVINRNFQIAVNIHLSTIQKQHGDSISDGSLTNNMRWTVFTRDSISHTAYAIPRICHANSVRPSVCLSHACFVSKRLNVSSKLFYNLIGPSF